MRVDLITVDVGAEGVRRIAGSPEPTRRGICVELLPVSGAPRRARNEVTDACVRWDVPELVAPATLIISELVSNVVDHARTLMTIEVMRRDSDLYLAVHDGVSAPPVPRDRDGRDVTMRGRGLILVAAAATTWGYEDRDDGKTVWATLAIDGG